MSIGRSITIETDINVDIEFDCQECGEPLEWEDGSNNLTIEISPCKTCIKEAIKQSKNKLNKNK